MQRVKWKETALNDLVNIIDYLEQFSSTAGTRLLRKIVTATENLPQFPLAHRSGRIKGTREIIVHSNYVVIYRVNNQQAEILRILHARQKYPPSGEEGSRANRAG